VKTLQVEVPEVFLEVMGSEEKSKKFLMRIAVAQLVKSKYLSMDEAIQMFGREWMQFVEDSGAFDFWNEPGEDIYTKEDGEPI